MRDFIDERQDDDMGDSLQIFYHYKEERDKREALTLELNSLRQSGSSTPGKSDGMTEYQFKRFEELLDKCRALECENAALYELVRTHVSEGKSPEDILAAVIAWRNKSL